MRCFPKIITSNFLLVLLSIILLSKLSTAQRLHIIGPSPSAGGFLNFANVALNLADPCRKYMDNATNTEVEKLGQHEYRIFEQCLYYYLANRAQHTSAGANFGPGVHPIATMPPNFGQKDISVKVGQITIQHFQLNEFLKSLDIVGYMHLMWNDNRLSWDTNQFTTNKLRIGSSNHIWVPFLSSQAHEASLKNDNENMDVRKTESTSQGNVSAVISFRLSAICDDTDFRHYPDDLYKCCYFLEPAVNQELVNFLVDGQPVYTDPKYFRDYGWSMSGTIPTVVEDSQTSISQLSFCLNLQRFSATVKIELSISTWACVIVFLLNPLFGPIRVQICAKLSLIFLQMMTLMLFSNRIGPHLGSAGSTPIIMAIHETGMVLNLCSLVFSILLWVLTQNQTCKLPPYTFLTRLSQLVNKYLSLKNSAIIEPMTVEPDTLELEKGASEINSHAKNAVNSNRYGAEWVEIFKAIHVLGVTSFSVIFALVCLLIR